MDDGVIKFQLDWQEGSAPDFPEMKGLMHWRDRMYDLGLIGYDKQHEVGYGNISVLPDRLPHFVISGTQTGHIARLSAGDYTEVTAYSIADNHLICKGPVKASSESLTHAAIYEANPEIRAVIHIHHDVQWEKWLGKVPTTSGNVPYGTPEMAKEIKRLFEEGQLDQTTLIAMAGHQGGIISFGSDLEEAAQPFLEVFE